MNDVEKKSPVPPSLQDEWASHEEAADMLRCSSRTVSQMISDGVLNSTKYGRNVFISRQSINKYLSQFRHVSK